MPKRPTVPSLVCALLAAGILAPHAAGAETIVYRCVDADGTLIFSDRPCDDEARVHQSGTGMSVIQSPENVDARQAANRAFIEQQRERRAEARAQREAQEVEPVRGVRPIQPQAPFVPYWAPTPETRPAPDRTADEREERFSALSGRLPGIARRTDRDD